MNLRPLAHRPGSARALAAMSLMALAACGGGGSGDDDRTQISDDTAQGYAADAATMPVTAGTALSAATATLQTALTTATAAAAKPAGDEGGAIATTQATTPTTTVLCALGGSVSWVVSGLPLADLLNRRLDAGESYDITYSACATAITGVVLNGTARVVVNAADASGFDLATTATALTATTPQGRFVLDGRWQHQLHVSTDAGGGTTRVSRFATPLATLTSTVNTRQARYELRDMDWTVTDTFNSSGQPVSRAHNGRLELFASTPRRPSATLGVATLGTLVIGSDGLAVSGGFSLVAGGDKWSVTYGATTVTIALDIGNDGSTERTWTLQRLVFHGEAG
jgi:hypothetical protein